MRGPRARGQQLRRRHEAVLPRGERGILRQRLRPVLSRPGPDGRQPDELSDGARRGERACLLHPEPDGDGDGDGLRVGVFFDGQFFFEHGVLCHGDVVQECGCGCEHSVQVWVRGAGAAVLLDAAGCVRLSGHIPGRRLGLSNWNAIRLWTEEK